MWGITIRATHGDEPYWSLVDRAAAYEETPSMRAFGYAAHITFTTYRAIAEPRLKDALTLFAEEASYLLRFEKIGWFDVDPLALWLKPAADPRLDAMHDRLHALLGQEACEPHYRPGAWQPHCTLATAVAPERREAAIAFAKGGIEPFEMRFVRADAVRWPPPIPVHSVALGTIPR